MQNERATVSGAQECVPITSAAARVIATTIVLSGEPGLSLLEASPVTEPTLSLELPAPAASLLDGFGADFLALVLGGLCSLSPTSSRHSWHV